MTWTSYKAIVTPFLGFYIPSRRVGALYPPDLVDCEFITNKKGTLRNVIGAHYAHHAAGSHHTLLALTLGESL